MCVCLYERERESDRASMCVYISQGESCRGGDEPSMMNTGGHGAWKSLRRAWAFGGTGCFPSAHQPHLHSNLFVCLLAECATSRVECWNA